MELFTEKEYQVADSKDALPLKCDVCHSTFEKVKKLIYYSRNRGSYKHACTKECQQILANKTKGAIRVELSCSYCSKAITRKSSELSRVRNSFCSHSCSASFNNQKEKIELKCDQCSTIYKITPQKYKKKSKNIHSFCSRRCSDAFRLEGKRTKQKKVAVKRKKREKYFICPFCQREFLSCDKIRKFCSGSCRSRALDLRQFAHSNKGSSRSKIEIFIENKLKLDFPRLEIIFNDRSLIGGELDIYIPALKVAFELNGVVHYKPIYGKNTFEKVKSRDGQKLIKCRGEGVELFVVNLGVKKLSVGDSERIYSQIVKIIEETSIKSNKGGSGPNRTDDVYQDG